MKKIEAYIDCSIFTFKNQDSICYSVINDHFYYLSPITETIHECQECGYNTSMYLILLGTSDRCQTIYFVKKYYGRFHLLSLFKQQSQLSFRFSDPLRQTVCSFPHEECHLLVALTAFICQCSSY